MIHETMIIFEYEPKKIVTFEIRLNSIEASLKCAKTKESSLS
jgi:hypothetical protein